MLITKSRNESGDITLNLTEMARITRELYKQLYMNELDNLHKMYKLLEQKYYHS